MDECKIIGCLSKAEMYARCEEKKHYLCREHFSDHIISCSIPHKVKRMIPRNLNNCFQLMGKIAEVRRETAETREEWENHWGEIIRKYQSKLDLALEAKNKLLSELDSTIRMCDFILGRIKTPIFEKDYYTQWEYLLITNDDIQREILDEIKPARIEKVEWHKGICKKINFYSSTFCHLLNNYNSYCIYLGNNIELDLPHLSYNQNKLDSPKFEFHQE